ncbi:hypothetical protein [Solimonas sp. SE-A11]|uniref:hypothetical protein n=1 Tax=Solimonas sp. SE-A11 TaxID=3054954 RepID=UPI00259C8F6B|nr:hypothetical protein [Solimonas sp. SE-A11]MDM4771668.1 hypothetical protein [Solimonas sp. SE-A11]
MSGPERKAPDDKLLEDFLEGRSPASRAWREARHGESAPPELDDKILGMAREEIQAAAARPPSRDRFRDRRWPFALAAVLVLSFSTLLTILQDPVAHKDAMMVAPDVAPADAVVLPEAAAPVAADEVQERRMQAIEAERQSMQAKRRMEERPAKPSAAPAAAAEAPGSGSYADAMHEPAAAGGEAEAPSAPAPAAAPAAPPPAPAPVMEESREATPAKLQAAPAAEMRRRALTADYLGAAKLKGESAEPGAALVELERIRRMLAEGREDEARRALQTWRQDWPERPVPADLQRLLD